MKWIYLTISVLVVSIALLIYELKNLDRQYTKLIEDGTSQLNIVQRLTFNSNRRHILLFYIAHNDDTVARRRLIEKRDSLQKENDSIFHVLVKNDQLLPAQGQIIADVNTARQNYLAVTHTYLARILSSQQPYIDRQADEQLDFLFLEYQKKISELYAQKKNSVLILSDLVTSKMERKSIWITLFSISPFLIIAILFAILIGLLQYVSPKSSER